MNPKLSIIIPRYNKIDLLMATLESLSGQHIFPAALFNRIYVPMWVFDYLLVYTRYRGFRKRISEHEK